MNILGCQHFLSCSGCTQETTLPLSSLQQLSTFCSERNYCLKSLQTGPATHWRWRAKIAVRSHNGQLQLGLFAKKSHRVVDIPGCRTHHPLIEEALTAFRQSWNQFQWPIYDEALPAKKQWGSLRYLQLAIDSEAKIQLSLVLCSSELSKPLVDIEPFLSHLWQLPLPWHSIWINGQPNSDNSILGPFWHLWRGSPWLWQTISHSAPPIAYHPANFCQANWPLFAQLVQEIEKEIPFQSRVAEAYCGTGAIGLSLLDKSQKVLFFERDPLAHSAFEQSLNRYLGQRQTTEKPSSLVFYTQDLSSQTLLQKIEEAKADTLIVDPPRKGLSSLFAQELCRASCLQRIIYISCHLPSWQKDALFLEEQGSWQLQWLRPYLFFPGTDHLEILSWFEKRVTSTSS